MEFLISGIVLGFSAGLAPGPLTALVMAQSIRHGPAEGVKVGLAPLLTDLPIVALALFVLSKLQNAEPVLGAISLLGAVFLAGLSWECLVAKNLKASDEKTEPRSIAKGMATNLLNHNPYLFWFSVGAPLVISASQSGMRFVAAFLIPFYLLLVGLKAGIALAAGRSRHLLAGRLYIWIMRGLGLCLAGFAVWFFAAGLEKLFFA